MTYVNLAFPYKCNAGSCASCGWQSRCGSWPFICSKNSIRSKYVSVVTFITQKATHFLRPRSPRTHSVNVSVTRARRYRRGNCRGLRYAKQRKKATSHRLSHRSLNSNFQVSSEKLHNLNL